MNEASKQEGLQNSHQPTESNFAARRTSHRVVRKLPRTEAEKLTEPTNGTCLYDGSSPRKNCKSCRTWSAEPLGWMSIDPSTRLSCPVATSQRVVTFSIRVFNSDSSRISS